MTRPVSLMSIFRLWAPLEMAWLLMAIEGPFLAALIARMPEATHNLAAFGVAIGFAMLFESPIILIMSASTALVKDRDSLDKLRRFTWSLNALITIALLLFCLPPIFTSVTRGLMGLPDSVIRLVHPACLLLLPWPGAIGVRRFYQGLLISEGQTRRITFGTMLRLSTLSLTALGLSQWTHWPGVWCAAAALSLGVVVEAVASRFWAREALHRFQAQMPTGTPLSYRSIARFYLPLALTSVLALGVHPMVSFFLGRGRMPLESLAVMPVLNTLVFVFNTTGLTLQEVSIALLGQKESQPKLRRFAWIIGSVATGALILLAFTPLADLWFKHISGLSESMAVFASIPLCILCLQPAATVLTGFQRARMVVARTTRAVTIATLVEVGGLAGALCLLIPLGPWPGAIAAALAMVFGRSASAAYFTWKLRFTEPPTLL